MKVQKVAEVTLHQTAVMMLQWWWYGDANDGSTNSRYGQNRNMLLLHKAHWSFALRLPPILDHRRYLDRPRCCPANDDRFQLASRQSLSLKSDLRWGVSRTMDCPLFQELSYIVQIWSLVYSNSNCLLKSNLVVIRNVLICENSRYSTGLWSQLSLLVSNFDRRSYDKSYVEWALTRATTDHQQMPLQWTRSLAATNAEVNIKIDIRKSVSSKTLTVKQTQGLLSPSFFIWWNPNVKNLGHKGTLPNFL